MHVLDDITLIMKKCRVGLSQIRAICLIQLKHTGRFSLILDNFVEIKTWRENGSIIIKISKIFGADN